MLSFDFLQVIEFGRGHRMPRDIAFMFFLRRISSTMTMKQLVDIFGRDKTTWSRCFWWVVKFIFDTHKQLLSDFSRTVVDRMPMYSKAIAREANKAKNLPPVNDFDEDDFSPALMIDCNLMKTCRAGSGPATPGPGAARRDPRGDIQRSVYNGWARAHGGKFETAGAPDGMTVFIFGLVSLRHNDAFVLTLSKILVLLKAAQQHLPAHMQRVLYGDSAYPWMEHLRSRHNAQPTPGRPSWMISFSLFPKPRSCTFAVCSCAIATTACTTERRRCASVLRPPLSKTISTLGKGDLDLQEAYLRI